MATIFFTCNDAHSKNDPIYLELIANFILDEKLSEKVNYIVRTSPAEEPTRFIKLAEKSTSCEKEVEVGSTSVVVATFTLSSSLKNHILTSYFYY